MIWEIVDMTSNCLEFRNCITCMQLWLLHYVVLWCVGASNAVNSAFDKKVCSLDS